MSSAHDVSDGGLLVALAECAVQGGCGAELRLVAGAAPTPTPTPTPGLGAGTRLDALLFGEGASRVLIEVAPGDIAVVRELFAAVDVPIVELGAVGGTDLCVSVDDRELVCEPVETLAATWRGALGAILDSAHA